MGEQKEEETVDPETQETRKKQIEELKNSPFVKGQTWCLIDFHWYSIFEKWVSNDTFGWQISRCSGVEPPGLIDNSGLYTDDTYEEIKDNMISGINYELVPEKAWNMLVDWYGKVKDQPPIKRKIITQGIMEEAIVEVYEIKLKLALYDDKEDFITKSVSRSTTISALDKEMRKIFKIADNKPTRMWNAFLESDYEELVISDRTVEDCSLQKQQLVLIEAQDNNGDWNHSSAKIGTSFLNGSSFKSSTSNSVSVWSSGSSSNNYKLRSNSPSSNYKSKMYTPGLCGLNNLGNTCFMNSALQCLSNVPVLTKYFQDGTYKKDLNRDNPLGMGGKLAKAYAQLVHTIWSGEQSSLAPREFKMSVGQFAPRFSGYQQHDSQELLSFLVDGLHEDLNRVAKKPYVEAKEADGRPDSEVAQEAWTNHQKRNESVIVDVLHGLFRSTVDCPECPRVSVTFDPFCFISLPLPVKRDRVVECTYVPVDHTEDLIKYKVTVTKTSNINDVCAAVSKFNEVPTSQMTATDVYNSRFHKIFKSHESIRNIYEKDYIYLFQSPHGARVVPVYMRQISSSGSSHLFGNPAMVPVSPTDLTYKQLYKAVLRAVYRYIAEENIQDKIDTLLSSDYDDDEQEKNEDDIESEEQQLYKLFSLKLVNTFGTQEYKQLLDDDNPISLQDGAVVAADWSKEAYKACFPGQWPNVEVLHESMKPDLKKLASGVNLNDCMELFTTEEKLGKDDAWYCSNCKKHQQANKKFDLWMLPPVLIIFLKRFSYTRYSRDKLDTLVKFPIRDLDLSDFIVNSAQESWPKEKRRYDLIAVSNHYGGLGGGHYTAYAKNALDKEWHYFDDSSISPSSEDRVVTKAAYMLVYQRQDLGRWMDEHGDEPYPFLEPIFSPRAMDTSNGERQANFHFPPNHNNSSSREDILNNNNADDSMDTS